MPRWPLRVGSLDAGVLERVLAARRVGQQVRGGGRRQRGALPRRTGARPHPRRHRCSGAPRRRPGTPCLRVLPSPATSPQPVRRRCSPRRGPRCPSRRRREGAPRRSARCGRTSPCGSPPVVSRAVPDVRRAPRHVVDPLRTGRRALRNRSAGLWGSPYSPAGDLRNGWSISASDCPRARHARDLPGQTRGRHPQSGFRGDGAHARVRHPRLDHREGVTTLDNRRRSQQRHCDTARRLTPHTAGLAARPRGRTVANAAGRPS